MPYCRYCQEIKKADHQCKNAPSENRNNSVDLGGDSVASRQPLRRSPRLAKKTRGKKAGMGDRSSRSANDDQEHKKKLRGDSAQSRSVAAGIQPMDVADSEEWEDWGEDAEEGEDWDEENSRYSGGCELLAGIDDEHQMVALSMEDFQSKEPSSIEQCGLLKPSQGGTIANPPDLPEKRKKVAKTRPWDTIELLTVPAHKPRNRKDIQRWAETFKTQNVKECYIDNFKKHQEFTSRDTGEKEDEIVRMYKDNKEKFELDSEYIKTVTANKKKFMKYIPMTVR